MSESEQERELGAVNALDLDDELRRGKNRRRREEAREMREAEAKAKAKAKAKESVTQEVIRTFIHPELFEDQR